MRIAIDARAASHPQRGGFKTYAEGLIEGLSAIASDNEYWFYVDRAYVPTCSLPSNSKVRVVPGGARLIGAGWREQFVLPWFFRYDGCQAAHFLTNTAPRYCRCPLVVTIHDLIQVNSPWFPTNVMPTDLYQYLIRTYSHLVINTTAKVAKAIITDSQSSRIELIDHYHLPPDRVIAIPLAQKPIFQPQAVPQTRKVVANDFGIHGDYILAIGSSDPRKNVATAIDAFCRLPSELLEGHSLVVVLAHGALRERLKAQVYARGLGNRVIFLASQPQECLMWLYNGARAFLFLSLYEGFGMPAIEAMACGAPVIASNLSSIPEVVGDAGILVNPREPEEVAKAITALLQNPAQQECLRARGLQQASKYSWERTARETVAVYKERLS